MTFDAPFTCSVVVPVHNESEKLEEFVMSFWRALGSMQAAVTEIHLVENGSTDNTYEVCRRIQMRLPSVIRAHQLDVPSYGAALKHGIQAASGAVISVLECDVMDTQFLIASTEVLGQGQADFVIASKRHPQSIDRRPFLRRTLTYLFNLWLKTYFAFPGTDTHGLKTIRSEVAKALCALSITGGEVFQTEITLLAYRLGYHVVELPVHIEEQRDTKVKVVRRVPKVINMIGQLRKSLSRFPPTGPTPPRSPVA